MTPFAGPYAHTAVAMRADQFISTHTKYLQTLNNGIRCKNDRPLVSVLTTVPERLFIKLLFMPIKFLKLQG